MFDLVTETIKTIKECCCRQTSVMIVNVVIVKVWGLSQKCESDHVDQIDTRGSGAKVLLGSRGDWDMGLSDLSIDRSSSQQVLLCWKCADVGVIHACAKLS